MTISLTPTAIQTLIAIHAYENTRRFLELTPQVGYLFADDMGDFVNSNPEIAFRGLVEILMRQTADERINGGTCHKNRFGFSKKHVTAGTKLALMFLSGEELCDADVAEAVRIAHAYREQLWMVRLGAVPVNHLNLRPARMPVQTASEAPSEG